MVNKHLWWLLFWLSTVLWSHWYAQETQETQDEVRSILDSSRSISALNNLGYSHIQEVSKDEAPNNILHFWKRISETEMIFLWNGCIQWNNAITALHVAKPSDWRLEAVYENPSIDIFIWKIDEFQDVDISSIHWSKLNGKQVEFIGVRQDKKWFRITGEVEFFYIPQVRVNDLYTGNKGFLSGDFYLMKKDKNFSSHTLSWSCVTHNGNVIWVLTWFVSIWKVDFFLISKVTPDLTRE